MRIGRSVITIILFAATFGLRSTVASTSDESSLYQRTKQIYFHWGSIESNRKMLELGGYVFDAYDFASNLSSGSNASATAQLFDQIRTWYIQGRQSDAAGSGFYFSSDPLDTRYIASDLLIVEVETPLEFKFHKATGAEVKILSDIAMKSSNWNKVPLLTLYTDTWNILTYPPPLHLNIKFNFRPPSANDAPHYWQQTVTNFSKGIRLMESLATELVGKRPNPTSKSADIFFRRLLFDHGFSFWSDKFNAKNLSTNHIQPDSLVTIIDAYEKIIPSDKRTQKLFNDYFNWRLKNFKKLSLSISEKELSLYLKFLKSNPSESCKFAPWILSKINLQNTTNSFVTYITLYDHLHNDQLVRVDTPTKKKMKALREALESTIQSKKIRVITPDALRLVYKHFSSEVNRLEISTTLFDNATSEWMTLSTESHDIYELISVLFNQLKSNPKKLLKFIYHIENNKSHSRSWEIFQSVFRCYLFEISNDQRFKIAPRIKQLYRKTLKKMGGLNSFELKPWIHDSVTPEQFERLVTSMANDFPNSQNKILKELDESIHFIKNRKHPLAISRLIARIRGLKIENPQQEMKEVIHLLNSTVSAHAKIPLHRNRNQMVEALRRSQRLVVGLREWSDIAKIFTLIEPLLLSEDLRYMNATLPQYRLNEEYIESEVHYRQPAWENFLDAWDFFSSRIWTKANLSDQGSALGMILLQTQGKLMQSFVDGTSQDNLGTFTNWDRKKYQVIISESSWKELGLDRFIPTLDPFFEFSNNDGHHILKFKDLHEISESISLPGYPPTATPSMPWLLSFIINNVYSFKDPLDRAAQIIFLMPKLHPFENGNGRLARLWATIELVQAGYPAPVGISTNDFFMTYDEIRLDIEKALELGRLWKLEIQSAIDRGLSIESFFQSNLRGSALEGLLHIQSTSQSEAQEIVNWLKQLKTPPSWGSDLMREIEAEIAIMKFNYGGVSKVSEIEKTLILSRAWNRFKKSRGIDLKNFSSCRDSLAHL